jgi:hypothetical protein
MALVIPQMVIPLMAGLFLNSVAEKEINLDKKIFIKKLAYCLGGLVAALGLVYLFNDYSSSGIDNQISEAFKAQQEGADSFAKIVIEGLMAERKAMFLSGITRVFIFSLFLFALLYLYVQKILSPLLLSITFLVVNTGDLLIFDKKFLNEENYINKDEYISSNFIPTQADMMILEDKDPHYRVYNLSNDRFSESKTSYFHRSLGGYHAAKLRNYQDMIETKFSEPNLNMNVLNMLDTKYFILPPQDANGVYNAQINQDALGAAWFVNKLQPVNNQVEELQALDSINTANAAIIEKNQAIEKLEYTIDSSNFIKLSKYNNDTAVFETSAKTEQYAVFSEVYYPNGWNAYVDGKATKFQKVNYMLRGMPIPAGNHKVEFIFEPRAPKCACSCNSI